MLSIGGCATVEERLQKIISRAGVASRRHAEHMILSGLVTVNGRVITELGTKADAERDHIKVSGKLLRRPAATGARVYLALNKPANVMSTLSDPEGRRSLSEFLHGVSGHVYPVGRLEYTATGLVLLTNDGELANRVMRARGLRQSYYFKLKGSLTREQFEQVEKATGVRLARAKPGENPWYEATLTDARRDLLREKLGQMGHFVEKIRRSRVGPIELGSLPPGRTRPLSREEVAALDRALKAASRGTGRNLGER
jgi:23S rRNA pseudouridine2605 synthase